MKTIEIEENDYKERLRQWQNSDGDTLELAEATLAACRGRLQEEVDNAAKVVENAHGYAGIKEEAAELMSTVRRIRREHLRENSTL